MLCADGTFFYSLFAYCYWYPVQDVYLPDLVSSR